MVVLPTSAVNKESACGAVTSWGAVAAEGTATPAPSCLATPRPPPHLTPCTPALTPPVPLAPYNLSSCHQRIRTATGERARLKPTLRVQERVRYAGHEDQHACAGRQGRGHTGAAVDASLLCAWPCCTSGQHVRAAALYSRPHFSPLRMFARVRDVSLPGGCDACEGRY